MQRSYAVMYLLNLRADSVDVEALVVAVGSQKEANSPKLQEEVAVSWKLDHQVLETNNLGGWTWQT